MQRPAFLAGTRETLPRNLQATARIVDSAVYEQKNEEVVKMAAQRCLHVGCDFV